MTPAISVPLGIARDATAEIGAAMMAAVHPQASMLGGKRAGTAHPRKSAADMRASKSAADTTTTEAAAHMAATAAEATSHVATTTTTVATSATAPARQGISCYGGGAERDGRSQDDCSM
jgi:hypothetical protein